MKRHLETPVIKQAVSIIMNSNNVNEDKGFKILRRMSMDTKRSIEDMARRMVYSRRENE